MIELYTQFGFKHQYIPDFYPEVKNDIIVRFETRKLDWTQHVLSGKNHCIFFIKSKQKYDFYFFFFLESEANRPDLIWSSDTKIIVRNADQLTIHVVSDDLNKEIVELSEYSNVTCNYVPEIDYCDTVVWNFRYFGGDEMSQVFSRLAAGGIFQLFKNLWAFNDLHNIRAKSKVSQGQGQYDENTGGLSHFWIAFQLCLFFISGTLLIFGMELIWFKLAQKCYYEYYSFIWKLKMNRVRRRIRVLF